MSGSPPQHRIGQGFHRARVGHQAEGRHAKQSRRLLALGSPRRVLARYERVRDARIHDERDRSRG
jgi:hypothetical protein